MEVFVLKSLERLRADSSRRDTDFRDAADLVIREFLEEAPDPSEGLPPRRVLSHARRSFHVRARPRLS